MRNLDYRPQHPAILFGTLLLCLVGGVYGLSTYVSYRENLAAVKALQSASTKRILADQQVRAVIPIPSAAPHLEGGSSELLLAANAPPKYRLGDEVLIGITLINRGSRALLLPNALSLTGPFLQIHVFRNGSEAAFWGTTDQPSVPSYPCQFIALNPGETYGAVVSLSRGRFGADLGRLGRYRIDVSYTVFVGMANSARSIVGPNCPAGAVWGELDSWVGTVSAPPVQFELIAE